MKILLACANSNHRPLAGADKEIQELTNLLQKNMYAPNLITEPKTTLSQLVQLFQANNKNINILHYSGHANGAAIELWEDTEQKQNKNAYAEGFARYLGTQDSVRFVFINGCSSKGQVSYFLQQGIKAVVATNRPIGDELALNFAGNFYGEWVKPMTGLGTAFQRALGLIATNKPYEEWFRGVVFEPDNENDSLSQPPYQLYTHLDANGLPILDENAPILKTSFKQLLSGYNPPSRLKKIFVSYHVEDEKCATALEKHFAIAKRNGEIQWNSLSTTQLQSNETESLQIADFIENADIVLLIISSDFMADEEIWLSQLIPALNKRQEGNCLIVPILYRVASSYSQSEIGGFMALPRNKIPVLEQKSLDIALSEIATEIQKLYQD